MDDMDENKHACFRSELTKLINHCSLENESNTPDYILAEYLDGCLINFGRIQNLNEQWHGRGPIDTHTHTINQSHNNHKSQLDMTFYYIRLLGSLLPVRLVNKSRTAYVVKDINKATKFSSFLEANLKAEKFCLKDYSIFRVFISNSTSVSSR